MSMAVYGNTRVEEEIVTINLFAQVVNNPCEVQISKLPSPTIKGEDMYIKITQEEYEIGLTECRKNPQGRLLLNKGDKPLTTRDSWEKIFVS
ncbi:hypothetical protein QL285_027760 [Trifolium repens]|nr:hypothetical protein QL285_027760 [Trifolium repens]